MGRRAGIRWRPLARGGVRLTPTLTPPGSPTRYRKRCPGKSSTPVNSGPLASPCCCAPAATSTSGGCAWWASPSHRGGWPAPSANAGCHRWSSPPRIHGRYGEIPSNCSWPRRCSVPEEMRAAHGYATLTRKPSPSSTTCCCWPRKSSPGALPPPLGPSRYLHPPLNHDGPGLDRRSKHCASPRAPSLPSTWRQVVSQTFGFRSYMRLDRWSLQYQWLARGLLRPDRSIREVGP